MKPVVNSDPLVISHLSSSTRCGSPGFHNEYSFVISPWQPGAVTVLKSCDSSVVAPWAGAASTSAAITRALRPCRKGSLLGCDLQAADRAKT